jgi:polyphosphate kinase 2
MGKKGKSSKKKAPEGRPRISRKKFEKELAKLEVELVKLQEWIKQKGLKVVVIFEGRDTAGKGGIIKRITNRLSPRVVRVVALPAPTEREKTQYYLQRYIPHLPAAGEMVLFDRSWYNRAGVEPVMGFCTAVQYEGFLEVCPGFERTLVGSGIILIKYWLDIDEDIQEKRFQERLHDPVKGWKLSPMDLKARDRWDEYTQARDIMLERTSTEYAPWYVVDSNSQRLGRLNCIGHLLSMIPYEDLLGEPAEFPPRKKGKAAAIPNLPHVEQVPQIYPRR